MKVCKFIKSTTPETHIAVHLWSFQTAVTDCLLGFIQPKEWMFLQYYRKRRHHPDSNTAGIISITINFNPITALLLPFPLLCSSLVISILSTMTEPVTRWQLVGCPFTSCSGAATGLQWPPWLKVISVWGWLLGLYWFTMYVPGSPCTFTQQNKHLHSQSSNWQSAQYAYSVDKKICQRFIGVQIFQHSPKSKMYWFSTTIFHLQLIHE